LFPELPTGTVAANAENANDARRNNEYNFFISNDLFTANIRPYFGLYVNKLLT
jgi:hypothetical protein